MERCGEVCVMCGGGVEGCVVRCGGGVEEVWCVVWCVVWCEMV